MLKMITKTLRIMVVACLALGGGLAMGAGKPGGAAAQPQVLALPISLVDVMRASIEVPADGIWAAEGIEKPSEEDWQLADQDAVSLIAGTTLVASAGTGKNDRKWVVNADWQKWVREMEKTALQIRADVKAQDQKKMSASADHLQEVCEGCHTKYRPQSPSDGVSRYPFYPKRELPK
jgi:hypothetical protein